MKALITSTALALGLVLVSGVSMAHHGASFVYDLTQSLTVTGTVTDFRFVKPHVLIYFEVEAFDGSRAVWSAGLTSPDELMLNDGWSEDMLQPGDTVTITGSPARGGAPSLWVEQVLDGNGTALLGGD